MSNYPAQIDTNAEIPQVHDNITEIGGEAINALREAIFNIESALGVNPQGSAADLTTRLNSITNPDGTFKSSALVAAGLIALPIVNAQVGASAGIEESKLDLDYATQALYDDIASNNIDIDVLQKEVARLLLKLNNHINGIAYRHDTDAIDIASALSGITGTVLQDALEEINNRFITHAAAATSDAHDASNISVEDNFTTIEANDVQTALEELDRVRSRQLILHRDEMHANGFGNWVNDIDGYNENGQLLPVEWGQAVSASIASATIENVIEFDGYNLEAYGVAQGDIVVITDPLAARGNYIINDVGPRDAIGSKPALLLDQLEITGVFPVDGSVSALIFGQSSQYSYRGNGAATVFQSGSLVDSIQVARPNAARVVSLGLDPRFVYSKSTLEIEVGVGYNESRTIEIDDLHLDRTGAVVDEVTPTTIVERINSVFQSASLGNAFPAAAYRVGDEIAIVHNWEGDVDYTLKITGNGNANFLMGFDGYGADVVGKTQRPSNTGYFYVNGYRHTDFALLGSGTGTIAGSPSQSITVSGFDPVAAGIKPGHLVHVKNHSTVDENGTYLITARTTTTITVSKTSGIAVGSFDVEVYSDALPLNEFTSASTKQIVEVAIDQNANLIHNSRLEYTASISNLDIIQISDSFPAGDYEISSTVNGSADYVTFQMGSNARAVSVPRDFEGQLSVPSPSNIDNIIINVTNPVGAGTNSLTVLPHLDEEEVLEVCSVFLDGITTASNILDKRLFGTTGLDEIREDYTQAKIEVPLDELRGNGVVRGLGVIVENYTDTSYDGYNGILIEGGSFYVNGVRAEIPTSPVIFDNIAETYIVGINQNGTFKTYIENEDYKLSELIDGYVPGFLPLNRTVHDGTFVDSTTDLRYFINEIDNKLDIIVDVSNRMVGNFSTFEAALNYVNSYPNNEKFKIRIVSHSDDDITVNTVEKDLTIAVEGRIGSLDIYADCKVTTDSNRFRTDPHIDGYLTINDTCNNVIVENLRLRNIYLDQATNGRYVFDNCLLGYSGTEDFGFRIANSNAVDYIKILNCEFEDGFEKFEVIEDPYSLIQGDLYVDNCIFDGGTSGDGLGKSFWGLLERTHISNTTFKNVGIVSIGADAKYLSLKGCTFRDMYVNANIFKARYNLPLFLSGPTQLIADGCLFEDIEVDSGTSLNYGIAITSESTFSNCIFRNITLASTRYLLNAVNSDVVNCLFDGNTYSTTQYSVDVNRFNNNRAVDSTNEFIVKAVEFNDNEGFNGVEPASGCRSISGNIFAIATTSPNIELDQSNIAIVGNYFLADATTGKCIECSGNENIIAGNYFYSASSGGTGIELSGFASSINIQNNIFENVTALTTTSSISAVSVKGNQMGSQAVTLEVNTECIIEGNTVDTLTITGTPDKTIIANNIFADSTLTISNAISDSVIKGNIGKIQFSNTATACVISENIGPFEFTSSANMTDCVFTDNVIDTYTASTNVWSDSIIANNTFEGAGAITAYLNQYVKVVNNIFDSNVTLNSSLTGVDFNENTSLSTGTLTVGSSANGLKVAGNNRFAIDLSSGASNAVIENNNSNSLGFTFGGTVSNLTVTSNILENIVLDANSTSGITIKDNTIGTDIDIFSTSGDYDISYLILTSNVIGGDIIVGGGLSGTDTQELKNSIISNNKFTDLNIFGLAGSSTSVKVFSGNTISENIGSNILLFGNLNLNTGTNTSDNNSIINNKLTDDIWLGGGIAPTASFQHTNTLISGNKADKIESIDYCGFDALTIKDNVLDEIILDVTGDSTGYNNLNITGNTISTTFLMSCFEGTYTLENFNITNNLCPDVDITFESDTGEPNFKVQYGTISNNNCRSVWFYNKGVPSGSANLDVEGITISGNVFTSDGGSGPVPGIEFDNTTQTQAMTLKGITISGNSKNLPEDANTVAVNFLKNSNVNQIFRDSNISGNIGLDIHFNSQSSAIGNIALEKVSLSCNAFDDNGANSGLYYSGTTGLLSLNGVTINSNTNGNIDFSTEIDEIDNSVISGNNLTNIYLNIAASSDLLITSNQASNITIESDSSTQLVNLQLSNNRVSSAVLIDGFNSISGAQISDNRFNNFTISNISNNNLSHLHFIGNYASGAISLPAMGAGTDSWGSGSRSIVVWNFGATWNVEGSGTIAVANTDKAFFFGNMAGASPGTGSYDISGATTQRAIGDTNSFTSSALTP